MVSLGSPSTTIDRTFNLTFEMKNNQETALKGNERKRSYRNPVINALVLNRIIDGEGLVV
jgi:hypothetical protein